MPQSINDYFLYLPRTPERERWGVEVLGGGLANVSAKKDYPPSGHPKDHSFDFKKGRVLPSLQILCITVGSGVLKTSTIKRQRVVAGSVFLLLPGEWHSYRPDPKTGWVEHWVELDGDVPRRLIRDGVLSRSKCFFANGGAAGVEAAFFKLHPLLDGRRNAAAPELAVVAIELLALCASLSAGGGSRGRQIEKIGIAERRLSSSSKSSPDLVALAKELGWGYSYFRREFKKQTGLSPWQFHLQAKLSEVQRYLTTTDFTLEEISEATGFGSAFHLSNAFKKTFGESPGSWRSRMGIG